MSQFDIKRENFEMKCCKIKVLLVTMQLCVGIVIAALAFYLQTLSTSMMIRECPYWAGIPLLVAGLVGIYYCATDSVAFTGSTRLFVAKCICFLLSFCCVFVCMVSSVFCGIPANTIANFYECTNLGINTSDTQTCRCVQSLDADAKTYDWLDVESCDVVMTSIKDYLILQCALNAVGSGVSMWFVGLLWKSRYRDFHSGLRFYSYSASVPDHPWVDRTSPHYLNQTSPCASNRNTPRITPKSPLKLLLQNGQANNDDLEDRRQNTTLHDFQNDPPIVDQMFAKT